MAGKVRLYDEDRPKSRPGEISLSNSIAALGAGPRAHQPRIGELAQHWYDTKQRKKYWPAEEHPGIINKQYRDLSKMNEVMKGMLNFYSEGTSTASDNKDVGRAGVQTQGILHSQLQAAE